MKCRAYPSLDPSSGRQPGGLLEISVDLCSHAAPLANSDPSGLLCRQTRGTAEPLLDAPDDQTLTSPTVTSSEDTLNARRVFLSGDKSGQRCRTAIQFMNLTLNGVWMFDLASCLTPNALITVFSGPKNPSARNTS